MEVGEHTELSLFPPVLLAASVVPAEREKLLREAEDKANEFVMQGDALLEAVVYKLLYARGLRIGTIEAEIRRALDRKLGTR